MKQCIINLVNKNPVLLKILPYGICILFLAAYSVLSIVRHDNYQSYGYDLGINDQVVWKYSNFHAPITTIDHIPNTSKLDVHVELIYALISPLYWFWSTRKMLLLAEVFFVCSSGIAIYLLAKKKNIIEPLALALLVAYLGFYGVQNALWFDVHSATFGAALTAWFIYFLETRKTKLSWLFFILAITAKEDIAGTIFLISLVYFFISRKKEALYFALGSLLYLGLIFGIYFPYLVAGGYRFSHPEGLFSGLNPTSMIDTSDKIQVYLYTLLSFGFIPVLNPIYLIPVVGNLASFFVLGSDVDTAQGLFLHYRIALAPLISWATIETIRFIKPLNNKKIALYILLSTLVVQYMLHLPLSYLTKSWFWQRPAGVESINYIKNNILPPTASVVAQNNIIPHITHRDNVYALYPYKRDFDSNSPCGQKSCNWFNWYDHPQYLFVDTSQEWDIRHLLGNRNDFIDGLKNLEKAGVVSVYKRIGTTTLYTVNSSPEE